MPESDKEFLYKVDFIANTKKLLKAEIQLKVKELMMAKRRERPVIVFFKNISGCSDFKDSLSEE